MFLDSEPAEELPIARASVTKPTDVTTQSLDTPISLQVATPDTPPLNQLPTSSHKKGGRPPNSRKGKSGKNQYTRDRDLQDGEDRSPGRSQSRDVVKGEENGHPSGAKGSINEARSGKSKGSSSKITMSDMKKRATGLLDFISRTQVEMAKDSVDGDVLPKQIEPTDGVPTIKVGESKETAFEDLPCLEMMDVLAKKLIKWQNEFG